MSFSFREIFGLAARPLTSEALENMTVPKMQKVFFSALKKDNRQHINAIIEKHPDAVNWKKSNTPAFYIPLLNNNMELAQHLVANGANVNASFDPIYEHRRAIQITIDKGHAGIVSQLIELKADIKNTGWVYEGSFTIHTMTPVEQAQFIADRTNDIKMRRAQMEIIDRLNRALNPQNASKNDTASKNKRLLL